ncbi:hypothetical protein BCR35DRAFT_330300 [Leucosporidium creatinivorum]|uniref:Uncharacterized protein n=1 Tax=Leucosporidium creatinivorum TaxID=106004 RepID=A0A1Y2FVR8_9BASI|nr:hypothetical protein BCR35DRAFT_330300 [Leucosporidium creatinivorum]
MANGASSEVSSNGYYVTELDLNVTWAAGTSLFFYVEADVVFGKNSDAERQQSWRGNVTYTVQSGSSQACIIPAHKPVVLDFRPLLNLSQCETVAVSWSGGIPPYAVTAMITNDATTAALRTSGSLEYNMFPLVVGTTATSLEWTVDYAAGVEVAFLVDSASSGSTVSRRFTVGAGSTACTIPDENQFKASSALSRVAQYSPWSMLALLATPFMLSM